MRSPALYLIDYGRSGVTYGTNQSKDTRAALLRELQHVLNHEIPLTSHLGLQVRGDADPESLSFWAAISPNLNHKSTAFAGSLNSVLTLAGWGLVWLLLKEWGPPVW